MIALGETMPRSGAAEHGPTVRRAPIGTVNELGVSVRYDAALQVGDPLQYQDNCLMQTPRRPVGSMSVEDAKKVGIADNDWIGW